MKRPGFFRRTWSIPIVLILLRPELLSAGIPVAPAAPMEERIQGIVRENSDPLCDPACTGYFLEDRDEMFLTYLVGSYEIYVGLEIDITGFRSTCTGCETFTRTSPITVVPVPGEAGVPIPSSFSIAPNYPNPFNPSTTIVVDIPVESAARLSVWDINGREVTILHEGRLTAGTHSFIWEAGPAAAGIYVARLVAGLRAATLSRPMLLLK